MGKKLKQRTRRKFSKKHRKYRKHRGGGMIDYLNLRGKIGFETAKNKFADLTKRLTFTKKKTSENPSKSSSDNFSKNFSKNSSNNFSKNSSDNFSKNSSQDVRKPVRGILDKNSSKNSFENTPRLVHKMHNKTSISPASRDTSKLGIGNKKPTSRAPKLVDGMPYQPHPLTRSLPHSQKQFQKDSQKAFQPLAQPLRRKNLPKLTRKN
jgi:hypothetical protein